MAILGPGQSFQVDTPLYSDDGRAGNGAIHGAGLPRPGGSPNSRVTRGHLTTTPSFRAILERYCIGMYSARRAPAYRKAWVTWDALALPLSMIAPANKIETDSHSVTNPGLDFARNHKYEA
jgi:hypothetical protein